MVNHSESHAVGAVIASLARVVSDAARLAGSVILLAMCVAWMAATVLTMPLYLLAPGFRPSGPCGRSQRPQTQRRGL